jgi:hypothetical protein
VSYSQMVVNVGLFWGQNFPYNHVLQAWNGKTGSSLPAFPQAVEDYQLFSSPVVADVSDAGGVEAIVGTGLYLLRDINAAGHEGHGWPKFTGGWLFGVPAVGDVDGDGRLEVAAWTREGYAFLWDTDRPSCGGNDEWWTFRHDEWSTGAYGTDSRPPGTARSLRARRAAGGLRVSWIAPGDDWLCGKADRVRIIVSRRPIGHPRNRRMVADLDVARPGGGSERHVLRGAALRGARYIAVVFRDEAGNWGRAASVRLRASNGR